MGTSFFEINDMHLIQNIVYNNKLTLYKTRLCGYLSDILKGVKYTELFTDLLMKYVLLSILDRQISTCFFPKIEHGFHTTNPPKLLLDPLCGKKHKNVV